MTFAVAAVGLVTPQVVRAEGTGHTVDQDGTWHIASTEAWNELVAEFNGTGSGAHKVWDTEAPGWNVNYPDFKVVLDADIEVSQSVGTAETPFYGIFNGQGYTITCNDVELAPFAYIVTGASWNAYSSIQNLVVEGTVKSKGTNAGGLVGFTSSTSWGDQGAFGAVYIYNCKVATNITVVEKSVPNGVCVGGIVCNSYNSSVGIEDSEACGTIDAGGNFGRLAQVVATGEAEGSWFERVVGRTTFTNYSTDGYEPCFLGDGIDVAANDCYTKTSQTESGDPGDVFLSPLKEMTIEGAKRVAAGKFDMVCVNYDESGNCTKSIAVLPSQARLHWVLNEDNRPTLSTSKEGLVYWAYEFVGTNAFQREQHIMKGDNLSEFFADYLTEDEIAEGHSVVILIKDKGVVTEDMTAEGDVEYRAISGEEGVTLEGSTVVINNEWGWHAFANAWNDGFFGESVDVRLGVDLTNFDMGQTTAIGTEERPFSGRINGAGHTIDFGLTYDYMSETEGEVVAPFRYVRNVEVDSLALNTIVDMTQYDEIPEGRKLAGLFWHAEGTNTVSNSSIGISFNGVKGIVAGVVGEIERDSYVLLSDVLLPNAEIVAPSIESGDKHYVFCADKKGALALNNCYIGKRFLRNSDYTQNQNEYVFQKETGITATNTYSEIDNGVGEYVMETTETPNGTYDSYSTFAQTGGFTYALQGGRENLVWGQTLSESAPSLIAVANKDVLERGASAWNSTVDGAYRVLAVKYQYADQDTSIYTRAANGIGYFNQAETLKVAPLTAFGVPEEEIERVLRRYIVGGEAFYEYEVPNIRIDKDTTVYIKTYALDIKEEGNEDAEELKLYYTGKAKKLVATFKDESGEPAELKPYNPDEKSGDYELSILGADGAPADLVYPGEYYAEAAGQNDMIGLTAGQRIVIEKGAFDVEYKGSYIYTGEAQPIEYAVVDSITGEKLTLGEDYALYEKTGENYTRLSEMPKVEMAGTYTYVVSSDFRLDEELIGTNIPVSYYGSEKVMEIVVGKGELVAAISDSVFTYTGEAIAPELTVVDANGEALTLGEDYRLYEGEEEVRVISKHADAGRYSIRVAGEEGKYEADTTIAWRIAPAELTVEAVDSIYLYSDAHDRFPEFTVKAGEKELTAGTDYEVRGVVEPQTEPGEYETTIVGTGNYAGSHTIHWGISEPLKELIVDDAESLLDVFATVGKEDGYQFVEDINLTEDVDMKQVEVDLEKLSHSNVGDVFSALSSIAEIAGNFNGNSHTISNLVATAAGLFDKVSESGTVSNILVQDAIFYVDPTNSRWEERNDTIFVYVVAGENSGQITNFGFTGKVVIDEKMIPAGKVVVVSLVGENKAGATLSGFFYDTDIEAATGNKRCITIKQNIGCAKNSGRAKVASSSSNQNKALNKKYDYSEEEVNKMERTFTADEFASGAVAYWLNWSEQGYTGEYKPIWRQGEKYPEMAIDVDGVVNALYKVNYVINDDKNIVDAPVFANNGDKITVTYSEKPEAVMVGEENVKFGEKSFTVVFDATKSVTIKFKETNALMTADKAGIEVVGRTIIAPAGTVVYTLSGLPVGVSDGTSIAVTSPGIYLVKSKIGVAKVAVK